MPPFCDTLDHDTPERTCGRMFAPAPIQHLAEMLVAEPKIRRNTLACEVCLHLDWYSYTGRPALSSATVDLRKVCAGCRIWLLDGACIRPRMVNPLMMHTDTS